MPGGAGLLMKEGLEVGKGLMRWEVGQKGLLVVRNCRRL